MYTISARNHQNQPILQKQPPQIAIFAVYTIKCESRSELAGLFHCQVAVGRLSLSPGLVAVGGGGGPRR